jgi:hypothetical protein
VIQAQLRRRGLDEVSAVEAARWLDTDDVLRDSDSRPGLPLRKRLRAGEIRGATQRPATPHGRWYITRVDRVGAGGANRVRPTAKARGHQRSTPTSARRESEIANARRRRQRAARKYRPDHVGLLLVAEAPPAALDRYFYFEDVATQDSLFRYVVRSILEAEPNRDNKGELLGELRDRGVFLIDLKLDPADGKSLEMEVPGLVRRVRALDPERIIVIKSSVYDLVREPLVNAGLPIIDERVPFPGSGQQRRFEEAFARALRRGRPPR